jgi:capsular polysaccharide biosynthesis protein
VTEDLDGRSLDLGQYVAVLRRRWYVVLAGLMVGVLGAFGYLSTASGSVTATATVNINVFSSAPFDFQKTPSQLYDPTTEQLLATSSDVLSKAATELGNGKSVTQMRADTTVLPIAGATIVKVSYSAASKEQAILGADAIANDYLDYRSAGATAKLGKVLTKLTKQRDSLGKALLTANKTLAHSPGTPQAVQADSNRQLIDVELTGLVTSINQLNSVDTTGGTLVSSAAANPLKFSPSSKLVYGGGALLGLLVGVGLAFVVNKLDRRVADGRALTAIGGGAILSELVSRQAKVPAVGTDLDQIRSLRERLLTSVPTGATLVVMDLVIRDRVSDVAVNLALAIAESGDPVRLVLPDHDDKHVSLLKQALDLEELESESDLTVLRSRWAPELEVVVTRDEHELGARGARFGTILTLDDEPQTTTLVSMPPTAPRSLWLTAGRLGHSIILVAARRETRISAVRQLRTELEAVGAVVHGSVLVPRRRTVDMGSVQRPARLTRETSEESSAASETALLGKAPKVVREVLPAMAKQVGDDDEDEQALSAQESPDPWSAPRRSSADTPLSFGEQQHGEDSDVDGDAGAADDNNGDSDGDGDADADVRSISTGRS